MTESVTRLRRGPSGLCRAALCVAIGAAPAGAAIVAGCVAPAAPLEMVPPGAPVAADAARLSAARAAFQPGAPAADSFAAAALRAAGLTPPFERRFAVGSPGRALVAGMVPGGNPLHRDSLVVAVGIGADGAAALLEAARMMATRSSYQVDPARTILAGIVFTGVPPVPESGAAEAVARMLGAPLWAPDAVAGIVVIGAGASAASPAAAQRGIAAIAVEPAAGFAPDLATLAVSAYEALVEAARPPEHPLVSTSDTSATTR